LPGAASQALYRTEANGELTTIAQTDAVIKDFYLSPYINDSGTVSFGANLRNGAQALFTGRGGDLTRIADTEPASLFSTIPNPAARIGARGEGYFRATLRSGGTGFFAGDGGVPDTLYVTELAVDGVVNTMPEKTMEATFDHAPLHGDAVRGSYGAAQRVLDDLAAVGVDYDDVTAVLEKEGVEKFVVSWNELLDTVTAALEAAK